MSLGISDSKDFGILLGSEVGSILSSLLVTKLGDSDGISLGT